jgi:hypothetical protein
MGHRCHATGCDKAVPPRLLMCKAHWYMVPPELRARVWFTYRPGQETDKDPSPEYLEAMRAAIDAVAKKEGKAFS